MKFLTGAAFALGVILLLPGACSLLLSPIGLSWVGDFFKPSSYAQAMNTLFAEIWLAGLALGGIGLLLILWARKRGR